MRPQSPEDLHFIALALSQKFVDPQKLNVLLASAAESGTGSVAEVLLKHEIITEHQRRIIMHALEDLCDVLARDSSGELYADISETGDLPLSAVPSAGAAPSVPENLDLSMLETIVEQSPSAQSLSEPAVQLLQAQKEGSSQPGSRSLAQSLDSMASVSPSGQATMSFSESLKNSATQDLTIDRVVGLKIANHTIEGMIGSGAQGQVFRARQLSLDRIVALKVLPPHLAQNISFINRFISEARTLATFSHPNIVQVYDVGVEQGVFYFTMEAIHGQTLKEIMQKEGRLPLAVAVNLLKQCLRGLERAARAGIIHRDIKPGNILVDDQGHIKLVDFGLAERGTAAGALGSSQLVGTPLYIAPEQAALKDVSSKSDQYSLGATFYHVITGQPPFTAQTTREILQKHISEPPPDACVLLPDVPAAFGKILQKMMAKDPNQRFTTLQDLFKVLEDFELREGLIEGRSTFLAEGLMSIGERSARNLWANVGLFAMVGIVFTAIAIGCSLTLDRFHMDGMKRLTGNVGATLLFGAFGSIMYIAGVRTRLFPKYGNIRRWLQAHIGLALGGYFLSMVHSGNFFRFLGAPRVNPIPGSSEFYSVVPVIPFLNSLLFTLVIVSGLVGRYIWRDIANQLAAERIQRGEQRGTESHDFTLAVFAQQALRHWRIFHYPMAMALVLVTLIHILSILYYG